LMSQLFFLLVDRQAPELPCCESAQIGKRSCD
jgi:hypothetical protein